MVISTYDSAFCNFFPEFLKTASITDELAYINIFVVGINVV